MPRLLHSEVDGRDSTVEGVRVEEAVLASGIGIVGMACPGCCVGVSEGDEVVAVA